MKICLVALKTQFMVKASTNCAIGTLSGDSPLRLLFFLPNEGPFFSNYTTWRHQIFMVYISYSIRVWTRPFSHFSVIIDFTLSIIVSYNYQ